MKDQEFLVTLKKKMEGDRSRVKDSIVDIIVKPNTDDTFSTNAAEHNNDLANKGGSQAKLHDLYQMLLKKGNEGGK